MSAAAVGILGAGRQAHETAGYYLALGAEVRFFAANEEFYEAAKADPDLGAVRIDFATWGRVRTPLISALARSLDHDYVVVSETSAERVSEVAVDRELERLAPELEL